MGHSVLLSLSVTRSRSLSAAQVLETMNDANYQEAYNDAVHFRSEARTLFRLGVLSMREAVVAEDLHAQV